MVNKDKKIPKDIEDAFYTGHNNVEIIRFGNIEDALKRLLKYYENNSK